MTVKVKYNRELLEQICERDKCIVDFDKIQEYNQKVVIEFICSCGSTHKKIFKNIYNNGGGHCQKCTNHISQNKKEKTCIKNYGVKNPSQLQEFKQKKINTCIKNYGVEHPLQSEKIKDEIKKTCFDKYGVEYSLQSNAVREKGKQSYLEKHGVEYPSQSYDFKEKKKQTCLQKYGVEHPSQLQEFKEKQKQTCKTNHGVEYPQQSQEVRAKTKQTYIKNYGVDNPNRNIDVRNKIKQTNLEKYGVENPQQNAEVSERSSKKSYKLKEFAFPCGNTIQIQGYEPYLLDILVKEGYIFEDIITKRTKVPEIWYLKHDKKCRYYCDAYIQKTNTIYEVKSTWTYKKDIEVIPLKKQACIDAGYNFELYVFDSKGVRQLLD